MTYAAHDPRLCCSPARGVPAAPATGRSDTETPVPPKQRWSFAGPFGKFDQAQLQRGFKVYREVCQTCQGSLLVPQSGGARRPGFTPAQAAAVAAEYQVQEGDPDGSGEGRTVAAGRPIASRRRSRTTTRRVRVTRCRPTCR